MAPRRQLRQTEPPPTPPADGPTPPAGGPGAGGPAGPGHGPAGGPAADGSTAVLGTVEASSDNGITVQSDSGDSVSATFTSATQFRAEPKAPGSDATAPALTAADFVLGSRVEIRVLDGNTVSARLVVKLLHHPVVGDLELPFESFGPPSGAGTRRFG